MEDLTIKYKERIIEIKKRFQSYVQTNEKFFSEKNEKLNLKTGDIINFIGGENDDIEFRSEILGFNDEGFAYVLWDCYWLAIDLEKRLIKN